MHVKLTITSPRERLAKQCVIACRVLDQPATCSYTHRRALRSLSWGSHHDWWHERGRKNYKLCGLGGCGRYLARHP